MKSLFETFLIDADGDKIKVDEAQSTKEIIDTMSEMLGVSKTGAEKNTVRAAKRLFGLCKTKSNHFG